MIIVLHYNRFIPILIVDNLRLVHLLSWNPDADTTVRHPRGEVINTGGLVKSS